MTEVSSAPGTPNSTGWDEQAAREWLAGPTAGASHGLEQPWSIAAAVISTGDAPVTTVLDAASGPGGFLQLLLGAFPEAHGVWLDSSEVMRDEAMTRLADLGDRVEYHVADLLDVDKAAAPGSVDVFTTSRATHHLAVPDLRAFYAHAATLLRPGGWFANYDSGTLPGEWGTVLRKARTNLRGRSANRSPSHPHLVTPATIDEHVSALVDAGFTQPQVVWREFVNVVLMARKA